MGSYSYKYVRDQLPPYVTEGIEDYEGGAGYDGDMWMAAAAYIEELERELAQQYAATKTIHNEKLSAWLRTRQATGYVGGPVIDDE